MEFNIKYAEPEKQRGNCVVVGIYESRRLSPAAKRLNDASDGYISRIVRRGDIDGKLGQTLLLHQVPNVPADRVLLVGFGPERELDQSKFREAVAAAVKTLNETGARNAALFLTEIHSKGHDLHWNVRQTVEAAHEAVYLSDELKSEKTTVRRPLHKLTVVVPTRADLTDGQHALQEGIAIAAGAELAKELGNLPGNICTPRYLADQAKALRKVHRRIRVTILDEADMEKLGMGALLSVGKGSRQPPRLIVMEYPGGRKDEQPVVYIGKGITFDAGGISIKPAAAMDEMKFDMCGAASVFGTMKAAAMMELPVNLIGVVPAAENLPDGNANKPGDIVTSMSGQTIEVLNTDAEGRLILCDALTYSERFNPAVVVDIATLTGACVIALGKHASGLLGNDRTLINGLLHAGIRSGDRAWELPLWDDYQPQLDSNFADMANIGGREGGAITAACFLSRFTEKYRWAHLDIAGTAWKTGQEKGATGRPVPLLTQYLLDRLAQD